MSRYLETLIAQARGAEAQVKPRLRSRFEPDLPAPDAMPEAVETRQPSADTADYSMPQHSPDILVVQDEKRPSTDIMQTTTEIRREITHHIKEHSERLERIEHRNVAAEIPPALDNPFQEKVLIVERNSGRIPPFAPPPDPSAQAKAESPPYADAKTVNINHLAPAAESERPTLAAELSKAPANELAPFSVAAEVTYPHREAVTIDAMQARPEITISIGVLDIRMTQEVDRRPPARQPAHHDTTLPLSDYLAKRSGDAS